MGKQLSNNDRQQYTQRLSSAFEARLEKINANSAEGRTLQGMRKILHIITSDIKPGEELVTLLSDLYGKNIMLTIR